MSTHDEHVIEAVERLDREANNVLKTADSLVAPYRKTAFSRFPRTFTFLVALGASAVYFGFEQMISNIPWLIERPHVIFGAGVVVLFVTGTMYKKLG